jgi:dTDP-4-dehydrorhamnose reductase
MKRILIVGNGILGRTVQAAGWIKKHDVRMVSRRGLSADQPLDIANENDVRSFFGAGLKYDAVVNCAAMTDVDACEKDAILARAVNALGVRHLAHACAEHRIPMVHVSSNYVFAGTQQISYIETDSTGPASVYGLTKLEGESYALKLPPQSAVIRTSWIYDGREPDFVTTFLKKLQAGEDIRVQSDQMSSATFAKDLADAVQPILEDELWPARSKEVELNRIYHVVNSGICTRFDMVQMIAQTLNLKNKIRPISRNELRGWVAVRPNFSALSCAFFEKRFHVKLRRWDAALKDCLQNGGASRIRRAARFGSRI